MTGRAPCENRFPSDGAGAKSASGGVQIGGKARRDQAVIPMCFQAGAARRRPRATKGSAPAPGAGEAAPAEKSPSPWHHENCQPSRTRDPRNQPVASPPHRSRHRIIAPLFNPKSAPPGGGTTSPPGSGAPCANSPGQSLHAAPFEPFPSRGGVSAERRQNNFLWRSKPAQTTRAWRKPFVIKASGKASKTSGRPRQMAGYARVAHPARETIKLKDYCAETRKYCRPDACLSTYTPCTSPFPERTLVRLFHVFKSALCCTRYVRLRSVAKLNL